MSGKPEDDSNWRLEIGNWKWVPEMGAGNGTGFFRTFQVQSAV
jgi:hypothetical protein